MAVARQSLRKVANTILCIRIEPNNDAIVLNVSDGGLSFRALSPVTQSGTIRFSFSENDQQIEASGELVWTDSTKMTGGLSFASLPLANRERIRNWVDQAGAPKSAWAASEPAITPSKESPVSRAGPPQVNAAPTPYFSPPGMHLPQSAHPGFALFEDDPQRMRYGWDQEMPFPNSRTKFFRGFLAGAIVSAILAAILFFAYGDPTKALRKQMSTWIGASPAPRIAPAALPPVAVPPPLVPSGSGSVDSPVASSPLSASADDSKANGAAAKTATEQPFANDHFTRDSGSLPPKAADPGEANLALAQRYLSDKSGPTGRAAATRFLWAAVEKGNVKAEITLADLYARGDGVTKSCDQAMVLLRAAARKGSSEASQELAQIIRRGCH